MQNFQLRWQQTKQGSIGYAWCEAMHTRLDLVVCGAEEQALKQVLQEVFDRVRNMETICNRFDTDSEVSRLNRMNPNTEIILSNDLFNLLQIAQTAFTNTGGLFDITIQTPAHIPHGANTFVLNAEKQSVVFAHQGTLIDLGGLAKGYTVDIISDIFNKNGYENYLISFGNSSIAAKGNQPSKSGWHVSLQNGSECFELHNECLSVSGNDYHPGGHIIDPRTGKKIISDRTITAKTTSAVEGEILSTVRFMLTT